MSEPSLKSREVAQDRELQAPRGLNIEVEGDSPTLQSRVPRRAQARIRVLRVAPPIDDGFRPFRVF